MSEVKTGGPAFPPAVAITESGNAFYGYDGMSLRDWFAGQALAGYLASFAGCEADPAKHADALAKTCFTLADALLAARGGQ